jgi:hypothetical protein
MKKITIGRKPTSKSGPTSPDDWISDRSRSNEPTKRLTIDISLSLHQRVKSECVWNGENMADVVRELLEERFKPERRATERAGEPMVTASQPDTEMQKRRFCNNP